MATTDCPPLPVRITKSLLGYGVIAGPIYVVAVAGQVATRDGFDPARHAASQLANGNLGWIQIATFLVTGAMTIAAAVGVRRALRPGRLSAWASGLLGGLRCQPRRGGDLQGRPVGRVSTGHPARDGTGQLARSRAFRRGGHRFCLPRRGVLRGRDVVRPQRPDIVGVVLAHYRRGVCGELRGIVVRIRRGDNDSGVHGRHRAGLGLAERGVGQALPAGAILDGDHHRVVVAALLLVGLDYR